MKPYKIAVYAICKNEEAFVIRWMDSMREADVVVVTDTGSADGTVEKLREAGAAVYTETVDPWRFDEARNRSLSHVPEDVDICVCTDLDEVFSPGWRACLEAAWCAREADADGVSWRGRYLYNWRFKADGAPDVQFNYSKIHERHGFCWRHPVHEYIYGDGTRPERTVFIDGMVLNHYPDPAKPRGNYLSLLETAVVESPSDERMAYYLGREYMYAGHYRDCADTLQKYLQLPAACWPEERSAAMRWIAASYLNLDERGEAYRWYFNAIAEMPGMRDAYVEFAKAACRYEDWSTVLFLVEEALKIKNKSDAYVNMGYAWDRTPYDLGAAACWKMGLYGRAMTYFRQADALFPSS